MIPLVRPYFGKNALKYLSKCYKSGWVSSQGKYVRMFEERFADYIGTKYALTTSSGTTALQLALMGIGVKEKKVAVPNLTFAATINAVIHSGGIPEIIGCREDTWDMDWRYVREEIAVPVHLYGVPCSIPQDRIIIEDCAEALGAKVGTKGLAGAFSFFANKVITTGEGGMVVTNDEGLYQRMKLLRDHGKDVGYHHSVVGFNFRMTNPQAALGLSQLEEIDEIVSYRSQIQDWYCKYLGEKKKPGVCWLYTTLVDNRDKVIERLKEKGIDSRPVFEPLSSMEIYKKYAHAKFPNSTRISKQGISLPTFYGMKKSEVKQVCEVLHG